MPPRETFSLLGSHYRENWPLGALGEPIPKCPRLRIVPVVWGQMAAQPPGTTLLMSSEGKGFQRAAQRGQGCIQKQSPADSVAREPLAGAGSSWGTAAEFLQGIRMPSTDFTRSITPWNSSADLNECRKYALCTHRRQC